MWSVSVPGISAAHPRSRGNASSVRPLPPHTCQRGDVQEKGHAGLKPSNGHGLALHPPQFGSGGRRKVMERRRNLCPETSKRDGEEGFHGVVKLCGQVHYISF